MGMYLYEFWLTQLIERKLCFNWFGLLIFDTLSCKLLSLLVCALDMCQYCTINPSLEGLDSANHPS